MTTVANVIRDALSAIGVVGEGQALSPEQSAHGLRAYNSLMLAWEADGIRVQFVPARAITDEFGLRPDMELGVVANLAAMLAPHYGRPTPPEILGFASSQYARFVREAVLFEYGPVTVSLPPSEAGAPYYDILKG